MRALEILCTRNFLVLALLSLGIAPARAEAPRVQLNTSLGEIVVELDPEKAPQTVANFLQYVNDGFYAGTIFHRVIDGFMIQGGGFTADFDQKQMRAPVQNEANNGLKNTRGSIAMARTADPHSASAQFFINVVDNDFLNHTAPDEDGWGYCVFGKVVAGMDVVDRIRQVPTEDRGPFQGVPTTPVVIESAAVLTSETKGTDPASDAGATATVNEQPAEGQVQ
jgi:cyclophilin family peptidyl-prolyl cis-trans isomerase